ncbi:penicillin-binding protein [Anaerorhabdus sp.]|uniref:penicillin-binding protein n=1 Tax=Anaerorhabdus sp. TaxID=1872524 RepID=UPI002B1F7BEC|nr:penicillin-binding protein [Anaerorhabdus sp.]MEA4874183.1 penicillin-binding protein [Anaerorhabdus sp.]
MKRHNRMLLFIFILTLVVSILVASNVFLVAVVKVHAVSNTDLKAYADSANITTKILNANRGYIYDRNGNIIAQDVNTYNIVCILDKNRPAKKGQTPYVDDPSKTAEVLAVLLGGDKDTIYNELTKNLYQVELGLIGRNLSHEKKEEIESYGLNGIEFYPSIKRSYPLGTFASNLIGFAQSDETGSTVGKMGLEIILDEELSGTNGYKSYQADKHGFVLPGMKITEESAINGNNVTLTLDKGIQEALEQAFVQTMDLFNADRVWGAVMEVDTGKVLAWGQAPSFDPNKLDIQDYNNFGAQLPYEPGSTMKSFVWAAAIDTGNYDGTKEVYSGPYCYKADGLNPYRVQSGGLGCITNASYKNWGMVGYDYGLILSSNSVTADLLTEVINPDIYEEYLDKFHFFQPVETDNLREEIGIKHYKWPSEKITMGYGQGSTVTTLQLLQAYSAIFGDGQMVKPYFVESIRDAYDSQKIIYQAETTVVGQPIKESTAEELRSILKRVVYDPQGTGKHYMIPEIEIAGKTGTTQVLVNGSYASGKTIASVMMAMPADDPKYMVYYAFEAGYDRNAHYKTEPIKTLLRKVAMLTNVTNINQATTETVDAPGEGEPVKQEIKTYEMPNLVNHSYEYAMDKIGGFGTSTYLLGSSNTIIDQFPKAGSSVSTGQKVFLLTDTGGFYMPDLTGWTRKEVTALWEITDFGFKISGGGTVMYQNVPVDAFVTKDTEIEVELQ